MLYFEILLASMSSEEEKNTAEYIFEQCGNMMFHIAFDYVKHDASAEDVVMQVAENICRNIDAFIGKNDENITRMVARYTRNAAINAYHKNKREKTVSLDTAHIENGRHKESVTEHDVSILTDPVHFGDLQKYVMQLPEPYQEVLMYRYGEDMTCREIAKWLGIPESTVSTRLNRALKRLANMFEEGEGKNERQNGR